ncbi:MAG: acyl carrier protein [Prevotellaceae bacterium]|jgi:acyl carrier protein|nr:acyl carrier protein [Prevotellaceae bacterium]
MDNSERYNQVFKETFDIDESKVEELAYQSVPLWDSVGHMTLIAALEEAFDIMMETDDIIDFSSYKKGMAILRSKYNVEF